MSSGPKIAIIGGGLIGLSTADSLINRGANVTIFEKDSTVGQGASRFNSGMIHPSQASPWFFDGDRAKIARQVSNWANHSRDMLMRRRKALGCLDCDRPSGSIQIFDSHYLGQQVRDSHRDNGVTCQEYKEKWSFGYYGLKFPKDESGDAWHYCIKLEEELKKQGCRIHTHSDVSLIEHDNTVLIQSDGKQLAFDLIIIAAGSNSARLLKMINYEVKVRPLRGHALVFKKPDMDLPEIPVMHWASRSALTVFRDQVRLSGTVNEESPDALVEIWEEIASDILEALGDPIHIWSADRPYSEIGRPYLGLTSKPNVWVNAGHGHMGWSLCTWSGEVMAKMIMDGLEFETAQNGPFNL